jgi:uncharacterized membrane protein/protein-disulfide isomerase
MDTLPENRPARTWPLGLAILLLLGGIGVAAYLAYVKLRLGYDPTFVSACNFGGKLNCDQVQTHPASEVFGLPLALYAVPTYLLMALLAFFGIKRGPSSGTATSYLAGMGLVTVLHAGYLAWVSHSQIGFYCPYCMALYAVNVGVTALAFAARGQGVGATIREAVTGLMGLRAPLVPALVFFAVAGGASVLVFQQSRTQMLEDAKARIAQQMAAPAPVPRSPRPRARSPRRRSAGHAAKAPTPAEAAKPVAARPTPKVTENGLDFFETPLADDEHSQGPVDAPVTFVAFKDFECGFCRYVSTQEAPLHAKYKDKVRFVFKHYPMNGDCNYRMGRERMHEGACRAAFAASCAEEQGKFWEMDELLYQNQKRFADAELRGYAEKLGMDLAKYDACYKSERPQAARRARRARGGAGADQRHAADLHQRAHGDGLHGDGRAGLLHPAGAREPGAGERARGKPVDRRDAAHGEGARKRAGPSGSTRSRRRWTAAGKAVSVPMVEPAMASWFEAKAACEAGGKRLCSEEEWVSACIGQAAADPEGNGRFTDGAVQGRMYPYGAFYEVGACRDSGGRASRRAGARRARTPSCVDARGASTTWLATCTSGSATAAESSAMMGGDWRSGSGGTCRRSHVDLRRRLQEQHDGISVLRGPAKTKRSRPRPR